ncbi:MAG: epoxyqueuosine reductase QueH [Candidatus Moranbacteria bacterium]|nr:epoxyqueuosine reductase QueH [Candidatus Moranbacteria bacterium]
MKERFLLHVCCAPCGIAVIDGLRSSYDLWVLFYNPNIFPETEYQKRKSEVVRVCGEWGIPMIDEDYDASAWEEEVKGLEKEKEGGRRCPVCFRYRLFRTAETALELGFSVFGTTLSSGRNKRADIIDAIGMEAAERFGVRYCGEDWKKGGRQELGKKMIAERGIYRQDYCGCRFSLKQRHPEKESCPA